MIKQVDLRKIEKAAKAATEVLLNNSIGPYSDLPRTAGYGYPEPYTRDLMLSVLGIAILDNMTLIDSIKSVLETLAANQSENGHIPSLVHDREERGASDTTPLFLFATGIYRKVTGKKDFLRNSVDKALTWMKYQSPSDRYLVAQQPTSDWRDEQWVTGYGLYVNTLVYIYLRLFELDDTAQIVLDQINGHVHNGMNIGQNRQEGFAMREKPYYAFWSYKIYSSDRFDLLGNSLAILSGIASRARALKIIEWVEKECLIMNNNHQLAVGIPPNFFPFIGENDKDWIARYSIYNRPGDYHNGGIWPFICGFYIAALVAAGKYKLAESKLEVLTGLVKLSVNRNVNFGFNEWIKAQNGQPMGQDWQTWSAALYLYAKKCVLEKRTPFFDEIRRERS